MKKGDELSGGKYISAPTIAELVQKAGAHSVVAAAKTVGLLLDRYTGFPRNVGRASGLPSTDNASSPRRIRPVADGTHTLPLQLRAKDSVTLFKGQCLPTALLAKLTEVLGPFPSTHLQSDSWTTKALTDVLWKDGVPALTILWLGEPDLTQHETAPGAPAALAAIKSSDENLGRCPVGIG